MREIKLTQGYTALVSNRDHSRVSKFKWQAAVKKNPDGTIKNVYARRNLTRDKGRQKTQLMHRFILGITDTKIQVDHRNSNGLNNQRRNLRTTKKQNQQNARLRKDNTSGYKGVSWDKRYETWTAQIDADNKTVYIGNFKHKTEAARAYNRAAVRYHGKFANLNEVTNETR